MRSLLATLLAASVLVLAPGPAYACSCVSDDLSVHIKEADSIGVGEIAWITRSHTEIDKGLGAMDAHALAVEFTEVYKGELGTLEKVLSARGEASCGINAEKGRRYVFFMEGEHRGRITTGLCTGTERYSEALVRQLQRETGAPELPVPVDTEITEGKDWFPTWVRWTLAGLGALFLLGALASLKLR